MNPFLQNEQDFLAAKFHIDDTHISQASHLAFLKIQSWKFALKNPTVGQRFKKEASEMLIHSFFSFVPNTQILKEEEFYSNPLN